MSQGEFASFVVHSAQSEKATRNHQRTPVASIRLRWTDDKAVFRRQAGERWLNTGTLKALKKDKDGNAREVRLWFQDDSKENHAEILVTDAGEADAIIAKFT
jgi:hypothetical protein